MLKTNQTDQEYIQFIQERIAEAIQLDETISIEDNILELGMDSLNIINLIIELETQYDFTFDESDLLMENFTTIRQIVSTVKSKRENLER